MAESELSMPYADLLAEVMAFLGYGSDSVAWTVAQRAEGDRYVQAGVRRFYYPPAVAGVEAGYAWSFLYPVTTLATIADQGEQPLPADLGRVLGGFFYEEGQHRRSIVQVSEQRLQELRSRSSSSTGRPEVASVRHMPKDPQRGQRLEVAWWPVPGAAYTLTFQYEAFAGKLSADNPYPLGGMRHAELLVQAILSVAEERANDEDGAVGPHGARFERLLAAAVQQDRRHGARHFGDMGDRPDCPPRLPRRLESITHPITYNGVVL